MNIFIDLIITIHVLEIYVAGVYFLAIFPLV